MILQSENVPDQESESVVEIFCSNELPDMFSHHDAILSQVTLTSILTPAPDQELVSAPRVNHQRTKITWSEKGIADYQATVGHDLAKIRSRWLDPLSKTSLSVLLHATYEVLTSAAVKTNKSSDLSKKNVKSKHIPRELRRSRSSLLKIKQNATNDCLKTARNNYKSLVRKYRAREDNLHNEKLFTILSSNPSSAFKAIRAAKADNSASIPHLSVGNKKYRGDNVISGFFDSLSSLKSLDTVKLTQSPYHSSLMEDYTYIRYLCSHKSDLPAISFKKSSEILMKMKNSVHDFFSLTTKHFINAGIAGFTHFNLLMNVFITNVNNSTIQELNTVLALLLYKSHGKDKTLDSSYRTISTCPLLAKSLDLYVKELFSEKWMTQQADTQYQGAASNHELASLLLTETIQHSKHNLKQPVYLLFLDAKSAFDTVVIPYLIRKLYAAGMGGNSTIFMENRLRNRATYIAFDHEVAGPIRDEHGLEQGGISSSDCYKLYNNEILTLAQESKLGVKLNNSLTISAVGQADDTAVVSNDLQNLRHLLHLVLDYCTKYNVTLSPSKTKLVRISPPRHHKFVPYNPISIAGITIDFVPEAEHVGVIRSEEGNNMSNILKRISSFKKALGAVTSCGLARGHRTNPVAALRILSLYGSPVLMSGLGSLFLSLKEVSIVDQQYKRTLQNILRLSVSSPACLVYFVAGSLPGTATIHLRQLTLFGLVCRLKGDPLHQHAVQILLTSSPTTQSWFIQVRNLLLQYHLPHPLQLLHDPPSKDIFKKLVRSRVLDFWETKLRSEAALLPSLRYFHPNFLSLVTPHRLLKSAGSNMYEVSKAKIQLLFLSRQYPCGERTRHWTLDNREGYCSYPACTQMEVVESPEHILLSCQAYHSARLQLITAALRTRNPQTHALFLSHLFSSRVKMMQFLLDPSGIPEVISCVQTNGDDIFNDILYIGRTWCYSLHRERSKRLGKWNFKN